MKEDRMTANSADCDRVWDADEDGLDVNATDVQTDAGAGWQQPQLIPAPAPGNDRTGKPNDRLRRAGLVGIAQARQALAEAARRAKARSDSMAA